MLRAVNIILDEVKRGVSTGRKWPAKRYYDTENDSIDYFFCPLCTHKVCIKHQYASTSPSYPQKCPNSKCKAEFGILR